MLESADLKEAGRTAEETRSFLTRHAFNHLLGFELVRVHRDGITIQCRVREDLLNSAGNLHGGVTASIADAAVGSAIAHHYAHRRPFTTVELKVNYFRPVKEGRVIARSRLLRVGSSICVGRVDMTDGERRDVGVAIVTYMFLDGKK
ncbi:MAG TPA: PaaI family thioesterase [Bryobacteraceae bacterium]